MAGHADNDLEVVRQLRGFSQQAKRDSKVASRTSDEALKWLDWPAYLQVPPSFYLCHSQGRQNLRLPDANVLHSNADDEDLLVRLAVVVSTMAAVAEGRVSRAAW